MNVISNLQPGGLEGCAINLTFECSFPFHNCFKLFSVVVFPSHCCSKSYLNMILSCTDTKKLKLMVLD